MEQNKFAKRVAIIMGLLLAGAILFAGGKELYSEAKNYQEYRRVIKDSYVITKVEAEKLVNRLHTEGYVQAVATGCKPLPVPTPSPTPSAKK